MTNLLVCMKNSNLRNYGRVLGSNLILIPRALISITTVSRLLPSSKLERR